MTPASSPDPVLDVLVIAGFGRSGSTLIDQLLGQVPGLASLGETRFLWERGVIDDERCGCGQPFHACPFWQAVMADLAVDGAPHAGTAAPAPLPAAPTLAEASRRSLRPWGYLRRRTRVHGPELTLQTETLARATAAVLRSAARTAGTSWLVESSKSPSFAELLQGLPGVRVHLLHLVRDSRAVAFSWQRIKERGQRSGRTHMIRYGPVTSAVRWLGNNLVAEALARRSASYQRLRYEDFVASPERTLRSVLTRAGFPGPAALPFVEPHLARVRPTHSVSGNPGRFASGSVRIRLDEEWRERLDPASFRLTTALTAPLLTRYGYPLDRSEGAA